jgi:hypothetical protein
VPVSLYRACDRGLIEGGPGDSDKGRRKAAGSFRHLKRREVDTMIEFGLGRMGLKRVKEDMRDIYVRRLFTRKRPCQAVLATTTLGTNFAIAAAGRYKPRM